MGELLHKSRRENVSYLIDDKIEFFQIDSEGKKKSVSIRDRIALYHTLSGYIKIMYPHKKLNDQEWKEKGVKEEDIRRDVKVIMPSLDLFGKTK